MAIDALGERTRTVCVDNITGIQGKENRTPNVRCGGHFFTDTNSAELISNEPKENTKAAKAPQFISTHVHTDC